MRATISWTQGTGVTASVSTAAANPMIMGSGWSLFQRYELYFNNSNLLDQIQFPGVFVNSMLNMTMTPNQRTSSPHMGFGAVSGIQPNYCTTLSSADGVKRDTNNGNDGVTRTCTIDLALPLIGVLGHATEKLIPLFLGGMRIDLTADTLTNYLKAGTDAIATAGIKIDNLEFVSNVVTIDAGSLAAVIQAHPDKLFIRTQSAVHSSQVLNAGSAAGLYELLISTRVSSQKALLVCPSVSTAYEGLYSGVSPNLTSGTCVNINNVYFPKSTLDPALRPMDIFAGSNRVALNSLYSANHSGCISRYSFLASAATNAQWFPVFGDRTKSNAFYWLQSTEVFGRKASLLSGVDTKSGSNFLRLMVGASLANDQTFLINMFSIYDCILECDLQTRQIIRRI